jgi:hypothetical protein
VDDEAFKDENPDARDIVKARTPVTARFQSPIPLGAAVKLLTEMADVQGRVDEHVLFITSKGNAAPAQ